MKSMSHPAASVEVLVIGNVSTVEGLAIACGSWYGFALSAAIGRSMTDHLAGLPAPELDQLSPQCIAHLDPARVKAFFSSPGPASLHN